MDLFKSFPENFFYLEFSLKLCGQNSLNFCKTNNFLFILAKMELSLIFVLTYINLHYFYLEYEFSNLNISNIIFESAL